MKRIAQDTWWFITHPIYASCWFINRHTYSEWRAWRLSIIVLVTVLAGLFSACATTAGAFTQQSEVLVHDAIQQSVQLHTARKLNDQQFKDTNVILLHVSLAGRDFTKLLDAGTAKPTDTQKFLAAVSEAFRDLQGIVTNGALSSVLADIATLNATAQKLVSGQ